MKDKKVVIVAVFAFIVAVFSGEVLAGPDVGVLSGDTAKFTGDQSSGIKSGVDFMTPPITTLNVNSLSSAIDPTPGATGIYFLNTEGSGITINSGDALANIVINTEGADALGIYAVSEGAPASYEWLAGLGIQAPSGSSGAGGPVQVLSYSDITTDGDNAHGIVAENKIGVYDPQSTATLEAFSMADVDISLTSVAGSAGNIGTAVAGDNGGLFTLNGNGTWVFNATDLNDVLAIGETTVTKVDYEIAIEHDPSDPPYGSQSSGGSFAMNVTKTGDGVFEEEPAIYFDEFDHFSDPEGTTPLWPDLQGYVDGLLGDMGMASDADGMTVSNTGNITTYGTSSHSIFAHTEGGRGSAGSSGTFWNANKLPTEGGAGSNGGAVKVVSDGNITTSGESSAGIAVLSSGGTGGRGGNGGPWRHGARGGTGGMGGQVTVQGGGVVSTSGDYASGIIAMSEGGIGGAGGSGEGVTGGGNGGFGGKGGEVSVEGSWDITTEGDKAHGIWAKSVGGSAGAGGSGGWLFGSPGSGGESSDGGKVLVDNNGVITTYGNNAYGIYGESIGGFGGSGGSTFGLFWAFGGDGGSAGSGGDVDITNQIDSDITTYGLGSHAIFAQSIGGGGGSGGGEFGLFVSLGGEGESGGNGGTVEVTNAGLVQTSNLFARGIYAQSIGGGGGDGDWSGGLVAIGGSGSEASHGGDVNVYNFGTVITDQFWAEAIVAQSIGGGGGNGGDSGGLVAIGGSGSGGGNGGAVMVDNSGALSTAGWLSRAIFAQSIGGGGGNGARRSGGVVSVGGSGGGSGNGGTVNVTNSGRIETSDIISTAIFAQSVGGGGGSGSRTGAAIVSLGGDAGSSGNGSSVTVDNRGMVRTHANWSQGIFAQSVGGGGGCGGGSGALIVSLGGEAESSGNGGSASVTNSGRIETSGYASSAIQAQSIGGGGGNGGGAGFGSLAYTYGGKGGSGGNGDNIVVTNSGEILTSGDASRGIFAQSIGGGGGNGEISGALAESLGGDGGGSGTGGDITIDNTGTISTSGHFSEGIIAQSIGGGGGNASTKTTGSFYLSEGGFGGAGGDAGAVTITTSDLIKTHGMNSSGIFAQSVGGGGGNAGSVNNFTIGGLFTLGGAYGGFGGKGGDGSDVAINSSSNIITDGLFSCGIHAQSIGGGGGNAGSSNITNLVGFTIFNYMWSAGGDSGVTGSGAAVNVESSGNIVTSDSFSAGILAQSIGGGGGNAGNSTVVSVAMNSDSSATVAMGGDGDAGGNGGEVNVISRSTIATDSAFSSGILAQSVGGGGGTGGDAFLFDFDLDLLIPDEDMVPSPGASLTAVLGGSGGASGNGGTVAVDNNDTIVTNGAFSSGILAQSVGGGGGAGGNASSYQLKLGDPISTFETIFYDIEYDFTLGGNGGKGGDAGNVTVTNNGDIMTTGAFSTGILAQSVGGGGGTGGNVLNFQLNGVNAVKEELNHIFDFGGIKMELKGAGGSGGNGGNVSLTNNSNIITHGAFAHGILAQSVGGGGGVSGICETLDLSSLLFGSQAKGASSQISGSGVSFAGSLGSSEGSGRNVTVTQTGDITTRGNAAHGIFAQSAGAKGFFDDKRWSWAGGTGGTVSVTLDGNISTEGIGSHGIYAQSIGHRGGSDISVNILNGTIQGGSGTGAGVYIDGGATNTLTNAGDISALSGMAILGGRGHDTINNNGVITGNVNLGTGSNAFNNNSESLFNAGASVNLGAGRFLNNSGTFSPGGSGTIHDTALTGHFSQANSGILSVDLDLETEQTDRLDVSGTSNLDGMVEVNVLNKEFVLPRTHQTTIISSAGGVSDSGLSLLTEPSAVIDYRLLFVDETDVNLQTTIDFSPPGKGLNRNQRAIGRAINTIQSAGGSPGLTPYLVELLDLPDAKSLGHAYQQLSPESYDTATITTFEVTQQYTTTLVKRMHSVRSKLETTGRVPGASQKEKYATWIDGFGRWGDQDADDGFTGFDYSLGGVGLGLDWLFKDGFLGGVSFGYSNTNIDLDDDMGRGDIKSTYGSVYGSCFSERRYLDMALSYGYQSFDNRRRVEVGGLTRNAMSDHNGDVYSAYVEAGSNYDFQDYMLQPFAALQYTYLDEDGYRESGAGIINLRVDERTTDSLVSDLGLRFYLPFERGSYAWIPELTLAWRHDFDIDDRRISAAFDGSPGVSFATEGDDLARDGLVVGCAVTLLNKAGLSVDVRYSGEFRSDYDAHQVLGGLRFEF